LPRDIDMVRHLLLRSVVALVAATGAVGLAVAAEARASGFYGGVTMRDNGAEQGIAIGAAGNVGRFGSPLAAAAAPQTLVFGGYRWRNDLALEAALGSIGSYRLSGRGGVGLVLPQDDESRAWNVDVYGSWAFWRRFSLYGRLGDSQTDTVAAYVPSGFLVGDRRALDGFSYGVGLRYDLNRALGLKLEYARVGTHPDAGTFALPEGDQVQFGLQFRF
jgi:hypothetical protein